MADAELTEVSLTESHQKTSLYMLQWLLVMTVLQSGTSSKRSK
jgi:hypothetical protein